MAERVHKGRIACELGAYVNVNADAANPGYFIVDGRGFKRGRAGVRMPDGGDMALGKRVGAQHVEHGAGLAVEDRAPAGVGYGRQGAQQRRVVEYHAVVRLVHLKGGDSRRHDVGHFVEALAVGGMPGGDCHVQAVVDGYLAVGLGAALLEGVKQRLLRFGCYEVNHGCGAAAGGGDRAGAEAVGADQAP